MKRMPQESKSVISIFIKIISFAN